jgi:hypothetical protein
VDSFVANLGGAASALAIASALTAAVLWWQQRQVRDCLATLTHRILRIDKRLVALAVELDGLLARGVGWHGIAIEPPLLRGHLNYLWAQIDELERHRAVVRGLNARGATERFRETVEEAIEVSRQACVTYFDGSLESYRSAEGQPVPGGAAGRDPLAALGETAIERVLDLRRAMELAIRTVAYQLDREGLAEAYRCNWPATRSEAAALADLDLWGSEPRPMMHADHPSDPG